MLACDWCSVECSTLEATFAFQTKPFTVLKSAWTAIPTNSIFSFSFADSFSLTTVKYFVSIWKTKKIAHSLFRAPNVCHGYHQIDTENSLIYYLKRIFLFKQVRVTLRNVLRDISFPNRPDAEWYEWPLNACCWISNSILKLVAWTV